MCASLFPRQLLNIGVVDMSDTDGVSEAQAYGINIPKCGNFYFWLRPKPVGYHSSRTAIVLSWFGTP